MSCAVCAGTEVCQPATRAPVSRLGAEGFGSSRSGVTLQTLAVCRSCGHAWQFPLPSQAERDAIYAQLEDTTYLSEGDNRRRSAHRALDLMEGYTGGSRGDMLNTGCLAGIFLEHAKARGWAVYGIEPSKTLATAARLATNAAIETSSFETTSQDGRSYAAICLWDVREHVADPAAFVRAASACLAPGGIWALNLPRRDSWVAPILGQR